MIAEIWKEKRAALEALAPVAIEVIFLIFLMVFAVAQMFDNQGLRMKVAEHEKTITTLTSAAMDFSAELGMCQGALLKAMEVNHQSGR